MIDEQMRLGLRKAMKMQNKSGYRISNDAGVNKNLARTFLNGDNDIKLLTLNALCVQGLGMSFNDILILGQTDV
jgi:hypothetical protein